MMIATVPASIATFLAGQPRFLAEYFDVTLVCASGPEGADVERREGMSIHPVEMSRQVTPCRDLKALRVLIALMRRERPDIVHSYTPKAGLLAMLAARATGVPVRLHSVLGMPLVEARGRRNAFTTIRIGPPRIPESTVRSLSIPGCRDIVRHGCNGMLVPPKNVDALRRSTRVRDLACSEEYLVEAMAPLARLLYICDELPVERLIYSSSALGLRRDPEL